MFGNREKNSRIKNQDPIFFFMLLKIWYLKNVVLYTAYRPLYFILFYLILTLFDVFLEFRLQ